MFNFFKKWREMRQLTVQEFARRNRSYLVIVLDPKDDTLFMSHRGKQVYNHIKSFDGKRRNVVKGVLKHSRFASKIDQFLFVMADSLQLPVAKAQDFYQWLDGAIHVISKSLWKGKGFEDSLAAARLDDSLKQAEETSDEDDESEYEGLNKT